MLCPKCGTDVGNELKLCARCKLESPSQAKRGTGTLELDELNAEGDAEESARQVPDPRSTSRFLLRYVVPSLAGLATSIALIFAYSVATSRASSTARGAKAQRLPTTSLGTMRWGSNSLETRPVSLFLPHKRRIEVGFFNAIPSELTNERLGRRRALSDLGPVPPDVVLGVQLKENAPCEPAGVEAVDLTFRKSANGLALAKDPYTVSDPALLNGLLGLACEPKDGGRVQLRFIGAPSVPLASDPALVNLELDVSGTLVQGLGADSFDYSSKRAKETVALWDRSKSLLSIGFFSESVSVEESERIRAERSLLALDRKLPTATVELTVPGSPEKLTADKITSYVLTFYRGRESDLTFPGEESTISFSYAGAGGEQLKNVQGALGEGKLVSGRLKGGATKELDGSGFRFAWQLALNTVVLDVDEKPLGATEESASESDVIKLAPGTLAELTQAQRKAAAQTGTADQTAAKAAEHHAEALPELGGVGWVAADGRRAEIATMVAVLYEDSSDLAIGFYPDELTPAEIAEIKKRRSLHTAINNKRAAMVIILDFAMGSSVLTPKSLNGYTMYFYRDTQGHLTFPGIHDAVSIKRLQEQLKESEKVEAAGTLAHGKNVSVHIEGTGSSDRNQAVFSWNITATLKID